MRDVDLDHYKATSRAVNYDDVDPNAPASPHATPAPISLDDVPHVK
ncbi:MAG: hypothetical protein QGG36_15395 [Pirellulaceae bacterium]|nr:hypothetical protein [Pirellulaceae bacterium]MDP7017189.1 hypothetical protein [Pirellulaceae bacterium]